MTDLDQFRREVAAWFRDNRPPDPGFLLPESFMEVGSDAQFEYLRAWQRKIYEAGYLGMAWPKAYGGGGKPQALQDIVNDEMARQKVPFVPNMWRLQTAISLNPSSMESCGTRRTSFLHSVTAMGPPKAMASISSCTAARRFDFGTARCASPIATA